MAKKKDQEKVELDIVDSVLSGIKKEYGEIFHSAEDIINEDRNIISIGPKIDAMLNGGLLEGTIATMTGKQGSGKTTTALTAAVDAQKKGKVIYYISIEGRIERKNLEGVEGLNLDPKKFVIIQSSEEKILTGNDFLQITLNILNQHKGCFVIVDSISAISDNKEYAGGVNAETRGSGNKLASTFIRQAAQSIRANKCTLILIGHLQMKQGTVSYWDEKIADQVKYFTSLQLRIRKYEDWKIGSGENEEQIGQKVHWEVEKNPLGPPGRSTVSYIRYGVGVDKIAEYVSLGEDYGFIEKSGSWYVIDFLPDKPKCQGEASLHKHFRENPKDFEELKKQVDSINSK